MPHATTMPHSGFQAIILCGPGVSLNTFTSNPEEFPKALVPIANRPMVWYPLDWCYRMGITKIHLVTPSQSAKAIEAALSQNPHLTSLPAPKADILVPENISHTSGTVDILRSDQVQSAITSDFIVLPCDLVCELPGERLIETWMIQQSTSHMLDYNFDSSKNSLPKRHQRGEAYTKPGLGLWYETRGSDFVKGAESDFIITSPLEVDANTIVFGTLTPHVHALVHASPSDSMRDVVQEKQGFPLRRSMIAKHAQMRMLTTYRDAHIYLFPHWVLDFVKRNDKFDSISEDVVGWWAKACWQDGLAEKLGMSTHTSSNSRQTTSLREQARDSNLARMTSTQRSDLAQTANLQTESKCPPIISYLHPPASENLIRRVDTASLLLSTSLRIAQLPQLDDPSQEDRPHPFAHPQKISTDSSLIAPRARIHTQSTLIAPNTSVAANCAIKDSCIGANCILEEGTKIAGTLLMDGARVESRASLQNCIVGRRSVIGKGAKLDGCEVQEGFNVPAGTVGSKGEKFSVFEGLENELGDVDAEGMGPESGLHFQSNTPQKPIS